MCRSAALRRLQHITIGGLRISEGVVVHSFGSCDAATPTITLHSPQFWKKLILGGRLAVEEAYLRGEWDCDDLVAMMKILMRNAPALRQLDNGLCAVLAPLRQFKNWLQQNTKAGSRRNVAAHYDLSNEFFALMLDPTMAYSAGIFESPARSLAEASLEKFERICRQLQLSPNDHLLEVGCGWGGLAIYAAKNYGCRVTATTISQQQYQFAKAEIARQGLTERITLLREDYRDLEGRFDKVVSVEMIEAVGEKFLDTYFAKCNSLLKPDGLLLLQAITIEEQSYNTYRRSRDFIQQYIFPGGFLPSVSSMTRSIGRATDLHLLQLDEFGRDYAQTLSHWRKRFWSNIEQVRRLGFDQRFVRMWDYYLCYCQAGFEERATGVSHILFAKGQ